MRVETLVYDLLPALFGSQVIIFGTDQHSTNLWSFIKKNEYDIRIKFFLSFDQTGMHNELPAYNIHEYIKWHDLRGETVIIANNTPVTALASLQDSRPEAVYLCTRQLHNLFDDSGGVQNELEATKRVEPFMMERGTPPISCIVTNGYAEDGDSVYELADFMRQEFVTYRCPAPKIPIRLADFSSRVTVDDLPMRMSHLDYLQWKLSTHVVQLSYSRRYLVAPRYNFFFLDIIDTQTGKVTRWHDKGPEEGLWDYVATGDFDDEEESFYFVRWPLADAIQGMADGSNKVRCQVGKLHLETLQAEILHEFDFQDRIHQVTISGDKRYMVFAPMRVLRPKEDPKTLQEEEVMSRLQEWVILDDMATLDLATGKVWTTRIPHPIPAHFELDPYDPHLFYVSTHSLMPHAGGVLVFHPGTIYKMRILEHETVIEGTYTHPKFIRTTQHCPFVHKDKVLIAATNQNTLEIIDAETMTLWHCHTLAADPLYDGADFSDPDFLKKPFSLPARPAHCDSISSSVDGTHLVLYMQDHFLLFDVAEKQVVGKVLFRTATPHTSHSRFYMQNAPLALARKKYAEFS